MLLRAQRAGPGPDEKHMDIQPLHPGWRSWISRDEPVGGDGRMAALAQERDVAECIRKWSSRVQNPPRERHL